MKKSLKKITRISIISLLSITLLYALGPSPKTPILKSDLPKVDTDLRILEKEINQRERSFKNLKPDNQARIVWQNPNKKEKTPYSIVYLHGFTASQAEGDPTHLSIAKKYGCNLYLARLWGHGSSDPDALINLTADSLLQSAKEAVAIGQQLGEKVILMGTSTGAALALYIAANNPQIAGVVLYSPLIDFYDSSTFLLDKPWGLYIARTMMGSVYLGRQAKNKEHEQYWMNQYRIEAAIALKSFIGNAMNEATFKKVKQPLFLGYYYKNEEEQDKVISITAAQKMFEQISTNPAQKKQVAFAKVGDHVIASSIVSKDVESVLRETQNFLEEVLFLKPVF